MAKKRFNLSNYQLLTGDMGFLYPVGIQEVLPGDVFRHGTSVMLRLSPMAAPVMHPMQIRVHHFFVPHRLVWDGFEDFITGGPDGMDTSEVPQLTTFGSSRPDVWAFWGLQPDTPYSALPTYGYNLIYNEYYRDQDLAGERDEEDMDVARIAWEKDYFTTARPWEQKGPDVTLPLGTQAPLAGDLRLKGSGGTSTYLAEGTGPVFSPAIGGEVGPVGFDPDGGAYADLSSATAVSISQLKRAFALQRFQEARAQYGSRYAEYLRYYGVRPADSRLDRPEYLGGGKVRVNVSEVLQSAPETSADPLGSEYGVGDLYGHGIGGLNSRPYRRHFPEHGYVHTLLSVRPKAIYQDQVPRHFLKKGKFDFFQREMQFIGQQAVWKGELGDPTNLRETFGYQDRYREYMETPSQVHAEFKDILDYWHLGRQFQTPPSLNKDFLECNPSKRIFNVQTHDTLWMMVQHHITALRPVQRGHLGRVI